MMLAYRWRGSIVLYVFGRVGIGIRELQDFEIVRVDEQHRWLDDDVNLSF